MQRNGIEIWVLDTFSKNFVISAFFGHKSAYFFLTVRFDNSYAQGKSVYYVKSKTALLNKEVKICVSFAVEYIVIWQLFHTLVLYMYDRRKDKQSFRQPISVIP